MDNNEKKKRKKKNRKKPKPTTNTNAAPSSSSSSSSTVVPAAAENEEEEEEEAEEVAVVVGGDREGENANNDVGEIVHSDATLLVAVAEKQHHLQKDETVEELQFQNASLSHHQALLEDTIQHLQFENNSHVHKQAHLETQILQLQSDNSLLLQKEAHLEEKLNQLQDEKKATLAVKEENLEEKVRQLEGERDSWVLGESASKETMAKLNVDITRLRMQVAELEESRNSLLKENQQLMVDVSGLQLQLQKLEMTICSSTESNEVKKASEHVDANSQIEAAFALVDKLIAENAELVEKVNELCIKLEREGAGVDKTSGFDRDLVSQDTHIDTLGEPKYEGSAGEVSRWEQKMEPAMVGPSTVVPYSAEAESGEIVQIPLEDKKGSGSEDLEVQMVEKETVPLTDAPLIGAPFRLISFVAKYVSGADLVDQ